MSGRRLNSAPGAAESSEAGAKREPLIPNVRLVACLAIGHLVVDLNQGAFTAVLPFLRQAHGLSYAAAGALVLVSTLTSSVIQPLFGFLADRRARRWVLPLSVFLAGFGLALAGVVRSTWLLVGLLILMGLGVAAYHPEGYKTAAAVAHRRKATAVSWFSVGGNLGIALGPPLIMFLVAGFGLNATLFLLLPAGVFALVLFAVLARFKASDPGAMPGGSSQDLGEARPGAIALLILVVAIRSWTQLGFATFIPFYYVDYLKADPRLVGSLLFVFLGAGAVGTLIGGPLADRWGARRFTIAAFMLAAPFGASFLLAKGIPAVIALALFGGALVSTFTVTVILGQAYLPRSAGLASGLIVGFAIGTGGVAVALLGWVADLVGVPAVLWISALMPLAGFTVALFLPPTHEEKGCA